MQFISSVEYRESLFLLKVYRNVWLKSFFVITTFYIYIAKMKGQTQLKTLSKDCTANAHHFWNLQKKQAGQK